MNSQTLKKAYPGSRGLALLPVALGLAACAVSTEGITSGAADGGVTPSAPSSPDHDGATSGEGGSSPPINQGGSPGNSSQAGTQGSSGGSGGASTGGRGGAGGMTPTGGSPMGSGGVVGGTGGAMSGTGGTPAPMEPPEEAPLTGYDFEVDAQGWRDLKGQGSQVRQSRERAAKGSGSLEVELDTRGSGNDADANQRYIGLPIELVPRLSPGQSLSMRIWVPADAKLVAVQPFIVTDAGEWHGEWRPIASLTRPGWSQVSLRVPDQFNVEALQWLGVQFVTQNGGWRGTVYIDDVRL